MSVSLINGTLSIDTAEVFEPLLGNARYKGVHGGRGSGKSHFFGEDLIDLAIRAPSIWGTGLRAVCIREVQKSLEQSVKRLIEDKIQKFGVGLMFDVQKSEIKTPGGGLIIFQGMQNHTAESIKSLEGYDVAWIEEAQTVSQRSLDLLRPTMRKRNINIHTGEVTDAQIWASWNPRFKTDPIDVLLRGPNAMPDSIVVEANWSDNPWFKETSLVAEKDYDLRRDPEKYQHIWGGGYQTNSEARVFRNWTVDEFETDDFDIARFYYGADWGFSIDPSVLVRGFIVGRTFYIDHEVYKVGCETDYLPFLFAGAEDAELRRLNPVAAEKVQGLGKLLYPGIPGALEWPIRADSARPETISYMQRHGFPRMVGALKGPNSVKDGIEFIKSYDIVVHPRCKHTIEELTLYAFKTDPLTNEVLPVLEDKKNHVIDALRYAVESARRSTYGMMGVVGA